MPIDTTPRLSDVREGDQVHVYNYRSDTITRALTVIRLTPTRIVAAFPGHEGESRSFTRDAGTEVKTRHNQYPSSSDRLVRADDPVHARIAERRAVDRVVGELREAVQAYSPRGGWDRESALAEAVKLRDAAQTAVTALTGDAS